MVINNFENQIFNEYAKNAFDKFYFTLMSKHPLLKAENIDFNTAFKIFYSRGGRYNIYFYVEFLQYLDEINVSVDIILEVMKYAAITTLFNRNTIYLEIENSIIGFTRLEDKIQKFKMENLESFKRYSESLKEFRCNYEHK
ncbi:MAG: hypothetical protein FWH31_09470 [Streptococcaceae bacterium]|nr:hypothetical protein [Streptococcaceae bacterium]